MTRFALEGHTFFSHHARTDQHERATDLGISWIGQFKDNVEILLCLVELLNVGLLQAESLERSAQLFFQLLRSLLLILIHERYAFAPSVISSSGFDNFAGQDTIGALRKMAGAGEKIGFGWLKRRVDEFSAAVRHQ